MQLKSLLTNQAAQFKKEIELSNDKDLKAIYNNWQLVKNELLNNYKSIPKPGFNNNKLFQKASEMEVTLKSKLKHFAKNGNTTFEELKQNLNNN